MEAPPQQTLDNLLNLYLSNLQNYDPKEVPEMEIRFGTAKHMKSITRLQYDAIIKRLLSSNFQISNSQNLLRISSEYTDIKTGITRMSNIRAELEGMGVISKYCKTNSIKELYDNNGVKFVQKGILRDDDNSPVLTYDASDFNFRASLNIEKNLTGTKTVSRMVNDWENTKKEFRYINRHTLTHNGLPVKIDVSIVRQSIRSKTYNFVDANLNNVPERYEIEIELNNELVGAETKYTTAEELLHPVKKCIKLILSGLQQTNYPISYSQQSNILDEYMKILWKENFRENQRIFPKNFIGPSSVALQINNIAPINEDSNIPNIRNNYTVTDKADGDRKLLFIADNGYIYLIDTNMAVQFTGARTKVSDIFNSIIDGEHILHNKNKEFINLYAAFDIYYINNEDVRSKAFIGNDKEVNDYRLSLLNKFINDLKPVGLQPNTTTPIRIQMKTFVETSDTQTIFQACNYISKEMVGYEYETDGLIFTPMNTGVGSDKVGETTPPKKITWDLSFKWKPPEFNTIDFMISIVKDSNGKELIKNIFESGTNLNAATQITQYKSLILRVGFNEGSNSHGYINPCLSLIQDELPNVGDRDNNDNYKPVQFFPTNPADTKAGLCNILLEQSSGENYELFTENKEVIEDNMIVEFRYNQDKENGWRWEPLRVRYDKTADLRNGGKNFGNAFHVANNNWHSIHNPVTHEMITTGLDIPNELGDDDIYYNRVSKTTITKALRDFHNLYVKKKLIMGVSRNGNTLIDYAVGMGGDIPKWIEAKLKFVFGIDISKDNIENRMNGACARYLNYKKRFKIMPAALFVSGDTSNNIRNLDAIFTDKGKQITNAIFGNGAKNAAELGNGVYKQYGVAEKGFDISSIQFAIHYMFESDESLHNFLRNVSETTKVGGVFIGTCFDGNKIFNYLKDINVDESKELKEDDKKLWGITKRYDRETYKPNESCVGYGIDIYMESINKVFREYLVNFEYLDRLLENYGFKMFTVAEANNIGLPSGVGSFKDLYGLMNQEIKFKNKFNYGDAALMTDKEKMISFFNNYFIYKKIRDVSDTEATAALLINQSMEEKQLEKEESKEADDILKEIKPPVVKKVKKLKLKVKK